MCPEAGIVVQELANRIKQQGGFALLADYGHNGDKTDTFRVMIPYVQSYNLQYICRK